MVSQAARHADDPASLIRAMAQILTSRLEHSGYQSGCAIATMVLELAPHDEAFSDGFTTVFARWRAALVTHLEPLGIAPGRAAALADLTISALEGAAVLSRAARSTEPFTTTTEALISAIDHDTAPPARRPHAQPARKPPAKPAQPDGETPGRRRPQAAAEAHRPHPLARSPQPGKYCPTALTTPRSLSTHPADAQECPVLGEPSVKRA